MESNDMNRLDAEQDSLDLPALWSDLQDLEDGSLAPESREALVALMDRSPAARRSYFEYFHQASVIGMEAAKIREIGQMRAIVPLLRVRPWWSRPWIAGAAALVIAAVIGTLVVGKGLRTEHLSAVASEGTLWETNGVRRAATEKEGSVKPGDSLRVLSGVVKLELVSGSVLVMQGPAWASFPDVRRPVLEEGWLWIDSGGASDAFEVTTPGLLVRDIGTRFGVRVGHAGDSEIHVLEGGVDVLSKEDGGQIARLAPDGKGLAIDAEGTRSKVPLANDPFNMLHRILSGQDSYRTTVLGQNPSGYWKFDEEVAIWSGNEVYELRKARCGPAVVSQNEADDDKERLVGFGPSNRSIYLPADESGKPAQSVVAMLDGGQGVSRAQGAVTFWIRRASIRKEAQALWLAGAVNPDDEDRAPVDSLACVYLTPSAQLGFFMENGDQDVVLTSTRTVSDDKWHQIGTSWGASGTDLYLDGERVARHDAVTVLDQWNTYGKFIRFGKPSDRAEKNGMRNFHGWFDEFAVWGRPLTPEEMRQQYKVARGPNND